MEVKFTIMKDRETEHYLDDVIGNIVIQKATFDKALGGIDTLGIKWLRENIGIHGRTIMVNTLLQTNLVHRAG